ncbi:hypothetical protein QUF56_13260 [Ureibacillus composti]|nr:hypothetical protein [Ureibacillus composti]
MAEATDFNALTINEEFLWEYKAINMMDDIDEIWILPIIEREWKLHNGVKKLVWFYISSLSFDFTSDTIDKNWERTKTTPFLLFPKRRELLVSYK